MFHRFRRLHAKIRFVYISSSNLNSYVTHSLELRGYVASDSPKILKRFLDSEVCKPITYIYIDYIMVGIFANVA